MVFIDTDVGAVADSEWCWNVDEGREGKCLGRLDRASRLSCYYMSVTLALVNFLFFNFF